MREIDAPEILEEATEEFIGNKNKNTHAAHLFLDIGMLLSEYGQENEELVFRKEIQLDDSEFSAVVKLYANGFTAAIGFESEALNRYLLISQDRKLVEGKMPSDPRDFVDDVVDRPKTHEATWSEIRDFQRLFDLLVPRIRVMESPLRKVGAVVDRLMSSTR